MPSIDDALNAIERNKKEISSLKVESNNPRLFRLIFDSLTILLELHKLSKKNTSAKKAIKNNFLGLYQLLIRLPDLFYYEKDVLKLLKNIDKKGLLKACIDLHLKAGISFQQYGNENAFEYNLNIVNKFGPSEESGLALSQFYFEKFQYKNALKVIQDTNKSVNSPRLFWQKCYIANSLCDLELLEQLKPQMETLVKEGNKDYILLFLKWLGMSNEVTFKATKNIQSSLEGKDDFERKGSYQTNKTIRLGYISSNFINHAQASQFGTQFFKNHDDDFELYLYSTRGDGSSHSEKRSIDQVDHFYDIRDLSDEEAVEKIRNDKIDIVVNCCGHSDDRRPYLLMSRRLAPIQIDYLGYPGTSGGSFVDYYVGDTTSTEIEKLAHFFTEKLILMPITYQPTEHAELYLSFENTPFSIKDCEKLISATLENPTSKIAQGLINILKRKINEEITDIYDQVYQGEEAHIIYRNKVEYLQGQDARKRLSKTQNERIKKTIDYFNDINQIKEGNLDAYHRQKDIFIRDILPPESFVKDKFVFCSLNNQMKLTLEDLSVWNQIMLATPNSVLVLFSYFSREPVEYILKAFDSSLKERIYFVDSTEKQIHLNRIRCFDLILDSFSYGAHTTASDAIWSGIPIITKEGETVEAKVCSGMLKAAGLDDLVTLTKDEYIELAIKLASENGFYQDVRKRTQDARHSTLFDRDKYIKDLCSGYRQAWKNLCAGKPINHIVISE